MTQHRGDRGTTWNRQRSTERVRVTPLLRTPGYLLLITLLAAVLAACSGSIRFEVDGDDGASTSPQGEVLVQATASDSGAFFLVRVPASRPAQGVRVTSDRGPFSVPPGHYPPPGQCRIWRADVPPGRQGPPGACRDLERQVPPGAYLIYG